MAGLKVKNLKSPDESRQMGKGRVNIVKLGDTTIGLTSFDPGWKWSEHVKPTVGTESCEMTHTGYCLSGRIRIRMDDGEERDIGPGDAFTIEAGHDAWVVGKEPCVMIDVSGMEHYAESRAPAGKREQPSIH